MVNPEVELDQVSEVGQRRDVAYMVNLEVVGRKAVLR